MPEERLLTGWGATVEVKNDIGQLPVRTFTTPDDANPSSDYQYYNSENGGRTEIQFGANTQQQGIGTFTITGPVPPKDKAGAMQKWKDDCKNNPNAFEENKTDVEITVMEGDDPTHTHVFEECVCENLQYGALTAGDVSTYEYTLVIKPRLYRVEA